MNITNTNDIKNQIRIFINKIIKSKVRLQYIKIDLSITYLKGSELKNDIPLSKDYLINIRSKYKKEQNLFIANMIKSIEKLQKEDNITAILYLNMNYTKVKKRDAEQFKLIDNPTN